MNGHKQDSQSRCARHGKGRTSGNAPVAVRLQKFLASAGVCSRRQAEKLILQGRIKVDGRVVTRLGTKVLPGQERVSFDGREVRPVADRHVYLVMNKPEGVLTTLSDPQGRPTIAELLKGVPQRIFPVGRLDMDSEGLLLLTDDGELAYRLLHPSFKVAKKYRVTVSGTPSRRAIDRLRAGVRIEGGFMTAPCVIRFLRKHRDRAIMEVVLKEGRKRQIRLMFRQTGHRVLKLKRTAMGPLKLRGIEPGRYRRLTESEIAMLRQAAGLA